MSIRRRLERTRDFRRLKQRVETIFSHYRFCKLKIDNLNNEILNRHTNPTTVKQYRNYVKTIDMILSELDREEAYVIRAKEIQRKNVYDMGYSHQSFYAIYRVAATKLLRYLQ